MNQNHNRSDLQKQNQPHPNVSIIITSYNNAHNLERCIKAVLAQDYRMNPLETIVVDSGSTDSSPSILERYGDRIKTVWPPRTSPRPLSAAHARNLGALCANGEILVFTDSDCTPGPHWVSRMVRWYRDPNIDCVIGNREPDAGAGLGTFMRRYDFILYSNKFTLREALTFSEKSIDNGQPFVLLASNNFSTKKAAWEKIGGMDTAFRFSGEDIMLEIDLLKAGGRIVFDRDNIVTHIHPISLKRVFRRAIANGLATYLLGFYSNNFIGWRQFQERGRNFNMYVFVPVLFAGTLALAIPSVSKVVYAGLGILFLVFGLFLQVVLTRIRLNQILEGKGDDYLNLYKLNWAQVSLFVLIHFLLKLTASFSFLFATILRYDRNARRKIKIKK